MRRLRLASTTFAKPAVSAALLLGIAACGDSSPTSTGSSSVGEGGATTVSVSTTSSSTAGGAGGMTSSSSGLGGEGGSGGQGGTYDCSAGFVPIAHDGAPIEISDCQTIDAPGYYVVKDNISSDGDCLTISSTSDVYLDCGGFIVAGGKTALVLDGVTDFEVTNCKFQATDQWPIVDGDNLTNGAIHDSQFEQRYLTFDHSDSLHVYSNKMHSVYQQFRTNDSTIACNDMVNPEVAPNLAAFVLGTAYGHDNVLSHNQIDGAWDLSPNEYGSDDGLEAQEETDTEFSDNVVVNNWDCGFETSGNIVGLKFLRNRMKTSGYCGMGGWYWSSVSDSVFADNIVDGAPNLFDFYRVYGLRAGETAVVFKNNQFTGNKFKNPLYQGNPAAYIPVYQHMGFNGTAGPDSTVPTEDQFDVTGNLFEGNDFGANAGPDFGGNVMSPGWIVDGGGNICTGGNYDIYPLTCTPPT